jgi:SAM-dependent methyltransferase
MNGSGARLDRPSPALLRLLPEVKPPPARVLLVGAARGHEARALDARGYDVTVVDETAPAPLPGLPVIAAAFADTDFGGRFDLVAEHGAFGTIPAAAYVAAAGRALKPGGQLFGAFTVDASELMHAFSPTFDVVRCLPGGDGALDVVLRRR